MHCQQDWIQKYKGVICVTARPFLCLLCPTEFTESADETFVRGDKLVFSVCLSDKTRQGFLETRKLRFREYVSRLVWNTDLRGEIHHWFTVVFISLWTWSMLGFFFFNLWRLSDTDVRARCVCKRSFRFVSLRNAVALKFSDAWKRDKYCFRPTGSDAAQPQRIIQRADLIVKWLGWYLFKVYGE